MLPVLWRIREEKRMGLIDKEALLEGIYSNNPKDVMKYIANFPEEGHPDFDIGKWEEDYAVERFYVCPDCGCMSELPTAFCASCGKQMREGEQDG